MSALTSLLHYSTSSSARSVASSLLCFILLGEIILSTGTIRQAVIGTNEYNQEWHREVIKASALNIHIGKITDRAKPGNDNGGLLSGDQKQRVVSNWNLTTKLPIPVLMLMNSQNPRPGSRHIFPSTDSNPRRHSSALDQSIATLVFSRLLCE